jgi:two-component system response regulator HydG
MMTAYGTVETAVQAMREGAYDFVEKPLKRMTIVKSVKQGGRAPEPRRREPLPQAGDRAPHHARHRGLEPRAAPRARDRAPGRAVERDGARPRRERHGQGAARALHPRAQRAQPGSVRRRSTAPPSPRAILEAELFGHERGAFTGAHARREGRFAKADGGTLFLDEIGELSPAVQVKLLRVLQEGEYEPVGGDTVRADVRIVAATNKDLRAEVSRAASEKTSTIGST